MIQKDGKSAIVAGDSLYAWTQSAQDVIQKNGEENATEDIINQIQKDGEEQKAMVHQKKRGPPVGSPPGVASMNII